MQQKQDVIAIYSRKSRFTGKGESIGNQVDLCLSYIAATFGSSYAQNAVIFEDEGFSGGNLQRPDFQKMMKAAHQRQFKAIVVYRLDRISRNIGDFSHLIEELGKLHIDFISIREQFDTSSPMGRAMMYIASVFSQLERETIAERIRDNMHELAKTGRWLGGTTPTGYTSTHTQSLSFDGKRKSACHLQLIPEEAQIIRKIYALYLETDSLTQTEAELLRQQVKTKTGRDFTRFSIKSILQNPVYLIADQDAYQYLTEQKAELFSPPTAFDGTHGILAYNRTHQEKGHATVSLPPHEWIVSVGQHTGLIPSHQWIAVQQSIARNQCKAYRKPRRNTALLTGLLWCSCGSRMYPKLSAKTGTHTYLCKCKERSKKALCSRSNLSGNPIDEAVLTQISRLTFDRKYLLQQLAQEEQHILQSQSQALHAQAHLQQAQLEIQHKITALVDSLTSFSDSSATLHIQKRIAQLHEQSSRLDTQITALQTASTPLERHVRTEICQTLSVPQNSLRTTEQKRALIRASVCKVIWDGQSAHVILYGAPQNTGSNGTHLGEDSK